MKRLAHHSQYFLRSTQLTKALVGHASIKKDDVVYDIGAGSGVISSALAPKCRKVIAIEIEPRTASRLRVNMERYPNVTVLQDDFLTLPLPKTPYKIFANIPFHLSSPIIRRITASPYPPQAVYCIVQKQFAHKLQSDSSHFTSQLGMTIGPWFSVRIRKPLKREDFWPHPNVDTVLLEIIPRDSPFVTNNRRAAYQQFTSDCFSDPKIFAKMPLKSVGIASDVRPSQLTLTQWLLLFQAQDRY
jgi:23S rRNA (adenine-N6)-dimethyltransferase